MKKAFFILTFLFFAQASFAGYMTINNIKVDDGGRDFNFYQGDVISGSFDNYGAKNIIIRISSDKNKIKDYELKVSDLSGDNSKMFSVVVPDDFPEGFVKFYVIDADNQNVFISFPGYINIIKHKKEISNLKLQSISTLKSGDVISAKFFHSNEVKEVIVRLSNGDQVKDFNFSVSDLIPKESDAMINQGVFSVEIPKDFREGPAKLYVIDKYNKDVFSMVPFSVSNGSDVFVNNSVNNATNMTEDDRQLLIKLIIELLKRLGVQF